MENPIEIDDFGAIPALGTPPYMLWPSGGELPPSPGN